LVIGFIFRIIIAGGVHIQTIQGSYAKPKRRVFIP